MIPRARAAICLVCTTAAILVVSAQTPPLRLVSTPWPPFTNQPGQPRFALDLVETALRRIGITAETVIVDAAEFAPLVVGGSFDGSAAAWRDSDRERVLLFSQPYLENRLILVGRRGSDVSATSLAALKNSRVAVVEGYSYGDGVDTAGPTFVRTRSEEDSIRQLLTGQVDHALMDAVVVQYIVDHHADQARTKLELGSTPLITRSLHLAVRRAHPQAQSIIDRFNAQLRTMVADGTYNRLLHVGWIEADIDGDGLSEYVSQGGRTSPAEPERAYTLFSKDTGLQISPQTSRRYFFGGAVYNEWAAVPEKYKNYDPQRPDPDVDTVRVFTFTW
jgi:polar amino acid transport system substrate-binding protein